MSQPLSIHTAYSLLQQCVKGKDIRRIYSLVIQNNLDSDAFLSSHIIRLLASCGSQMEANQAFDKVVSPSAYTWGAVISANAKLGYADNALELFKQMQLSGMKNNRYVYLAVLKACAATSNISQGQYIHDQVIRDGLDSDLVLGNSLVDMYAKCGEILEACKVFDRLSKTDVVSWGAIIAGYCQQGDGQFALDLSYKMQQDGITLDKVIYFGLLKACAIVEGLEQGRLLHEQIIQNGLPLDFILGNNLVDMYIKCGSLLEANNVFEKVDGPDIILWNVIIGGYVQYGHPFVAIELFGNMQKEAIKPNKVTYASILKACGSIEAQHQGVFIHHLFMENEHALDLVVGSTLVDMYAKCGALKEAHKVFSQLDTPDLVSWNVIIAGYAEHGYGGSALELFEEMQCEGVEPEKLTFLSALKACGTIESIEQVRRTHEQIIENGHISDVIVGSSLVDIYAKHGSLDEARKVFENLPNRNLVSWGAMIAGYSQHGEGILALELLDDMQDEAIIPNNIIFSSILKACGSIGVTSQGRIIHSQVIEDGFELELIVGNTLIDMYAKCACVNEARIVFDKLPNKNLISWGGMISGYADQGDSLAAIELLEQMQQLEMKLDKLLFLSMLKACGSIGAVGKSRIAHSKILKSGIELEDVMWNAIIDMYSKCGNLEEAQTVFDIMPSHDSVSWNTMISGCGQDGNARLASHCFEKMNMEHIKPNEATFASILVACSRAGLLDEGRRYFKFMTEDYGMVPDTNHYNCMADLLGRAGYLNEANDLIQAADQPNLIAWTSILSACRIYGNIQLGQQYSDKIVQVDPSCTAGYVLLSNIYAEPKCPKLL